MASMLDNIQALVTPAILSRLTGQTGESESAVVKGFGAAIPAMLSTIAGRSDDHGFFRQLADLATSTAADPDALRRSAVMPSTPSGIDTTTPIGGWLSGLFGHNLSGVTDAIGRYAGIRGSSAGSLLTMAAPLVLGYLGRLMRSDNLSATGLAERLRSEGSQFASALPYGFEMPRIFRAPVEAVHAVEEPRRVAVTREGEGAGWNLPLMLLLGALAIGGLMWWAARQHEEQARIRDTMSTAVGTTGTVSGMLTRQLPGNIILRIPAGGAEDRLAMYLGSIASGSTAIEFDRIGFDTGWATRTPQSHEQIGNMAAILRAYPKATVTVSGHTDNRGDDEANLALSRARAESVASALTEAGVAGQRVSAEGYGSKKPVADNSTEQGRAQNRRVVLEVAVK